MSIAVNASTWPINPAGGTGAVWVDGSGAWDLLPHLPSFVVGPKGERTCWQAIGGAGAVAKFTGSDTVAVNLQAFPAQVQVSGTYTFNPSGIFAGGASFAVSGNLTYNGGVQLAALTGAGTTTFTGAGPFMVGSVDLQWHLNVKSLIGYTGTLNVPYRNTAPTIYSLGAAGLTGTAFRSSVGNVLYCYTGGVFTLTPLFSDPEMDAITVTTLGLTLGSTSHSGTTAPAGSPPAGAGQVTGSQIAFTAGGTAGTTNMTIRATDSLGLHQYLAATVEIGAAGVSWIAGGYYYWPATRSTNYTWPSYISNTQCPTVFSSNPTITMGSQRGENDFTGASSSFTGVIRADTTTSIGEPGTSVVVRPYNSDGSLSGASIGTPTLYATGDWSNKVGGAGYAPFTWAGSAMGYSGSAATCSVAVTCPQLDGGATNYASLQFEHGVYTLSGAFNANGGLLVGKYDDPNSNIFTTVAYSGTGAFKEIWVRRATGISSQVTFSTAPNFAGNPYGTTSIQVPNPYDRSWGGGSFTKQILGWSSGTSSGTPTIGYVPMGGETLGAPVAAGGYTTWTISTGVGRYELRPTSGLFYIQPA